MMWAKGRKREKAGGGGGGVKNNPIPVIITSLNCFTVLYSYALHT